MACTLRAPLLPKIRTKSTPLFNNARSAFEAISVAHNLLGFFKNKRVTSRATFPLPIMPTVLQLLKSKFMILWPGCPFIQPMKSSDVRMRSLEGNFIGSSLALLLPVQITTAEDTFKTSSICKSPPTLTPPKYSNRRHLNKFSTFRRQF